VLVLPGSAAGCDAKFYVTQFFIVLIFTVLSITPGQERHLAAVTAAGLYGQDSHARTLRVSMQPKGTKVSPSRLASWTLQPLLSPSGAINTLLLDP